MSIKPIDMQVIVQRSTDVAKVRSDEQTRNQQIAQAGTQDVQKKADAETEKVHTQANIQEATIHNQERERKRQGNSTYSGKKQKKKSEDNDSQNTTNEKTGSIDIRI